MSRFPLQDELVPQVADAGRAEGARWLDGISLPPALLTGHKKVDFEHRHLLSSIQNVRRVCDDLAGRRDCTACHQNRQDCCENDLVSLLGDLLAFILDHFRHEEAIMRESLLLAIDRQVCEAHMEDHAAISAKIQEIVARIDRGRVVTLLRDLDALLASWINNHIHLHDMILADWLERHDVHSAFAKTQAS